jgi:hypothetical protein
MSLPSKSDVGAANNNSCAYESRDQFDEKTKDLKAKTERLQIKTGEGNNKPRWNVLGHSSSSNYLCQYF